jgi:hypothetical protein
LSTRFCTSALGWPSLKCQIEKPSVLVVVLHLKRFFVILETCKRLVSISLNLGFNGEVNVEVLTELRQTLAIAYNNLVRAAFKWWEWLNFECIGGDLVRFPWVGYQFAEEAAFVLVRKASDWIWTGGWCAMKDMEFVDQLAFAAG